MTYVELPKPRNKKATIHLPSLETKFQVSESSNYFGCNLDEIKASAPDVYSSRSNVKFFGPCLLCTQTSQQVDQEE